MLFNTIGYAAFFAIVFVVSWLLARAQRLRLLFLLGASYFFYAEWDWRFLPLIWGSSTLDWWLAKKIHGAATQHKGRWLWLTVVVNLGVLGFFKYFGFGVDTARAIAASLGYQVPELALSIALPVGISFFTFESMSYVIDVYRGELEPHESYFEYLTFVAFFPHLVAGPIVRPRDLLPQLAQAARWNEREGSEGLFLIGLGLAKKIVIGDYLALNLVDRVFDAPLQYSALETYAAVLGYSLQIYCDFSGYTDIAIGSALLLGVRFPPNFDSPYQSASIVEFWRRWHISLSTWLRDYLYIPLGGNRRGRARTYFNLLATMVLGGLWHGASWTFVVWGTMHGGALAFEKWWGEFWGGRSSARPARSQLVARGSDLGTDRGTSTKTRAALRRTLGVLLTFHFVCAAWIFFRAASFGEASLVFSRLASLTTYHPNLSPPVVGILALGLVTHFVPNALFHRVRERFIDLPGVLQGALLFALAILLRQLSSSEAVPFVYFQF